MRTIGLAATTCGLMVMLAGLALGGGDKGKPDKEKPGPAVKKGAR
jgi:hypothetical protein